MNDKPSYAMTFLKRIFLAVYLRNVLLAFGGLASFSAMALEPAADVPPPKEPVLPRAPTQAEWTVQIRIDRDKAKKQELEPKKGEPGEAAEEKPPPRVPVLSPIEIKVSKDGVIYREIITWSNGKKTEKWIVDGLQLCEIPQTGEIMRVDVASFGSDVSDYSASDFEAAQWVGKDNYKGAKMAGSRPVYEFVVENAQRRQTARDLALNQFNSEGNRPSAAGRQGQQIAYLDARTQLPIVADDGDTVRIYKFSPSAGPLVVPDRFALEFKAWKDLIARKTRPATPP